MTSSPKDVTLRSIKRGFKLMNQFRPVTMIARTTPGTDTTRISAQTVTHSLREFGESPPYTMYVVYAAFLFWLSIYDIDRPWYYCASRISMDIVFGDLFYLCGLMAK